MMRQQQSTKETPWLQCNGCHVMIRVLKSISYAPVVKRMAQSLLSPQPKLNVRQGLKAQHHCLPPRLSLQPAGTAAPAARPVPAALRPPSHTQPAAAQMPLSSSQQQLPLRPLPMPLHDLLLPVLLPGGPVLLPDLDCLMTSECQWTPGTDASPAAAAAQGMCTSDTSTQTAGNDMFLWLAACIAVFGMVHHCHAMLAETSLHCWQ